jgi:hypothetical protein
MERNNILVLLVEKPVSFGLQGNLLLVSDAASMDFFVWKEVETSELECNAIAIQFQNVQTLRTV